MAKIRICRHEGCKNAATTKGFCRLHYLRYWKTIKDAESKKAARKLNSYIENICKTHPDRYLEVIKENIRENRFAEDAEDVFDHINEGGAIFDEPTYDEEIEELLHELKIEKGF